jgi:protein-disulfide isomerase
LRSRPEDGHVPRLKDAGSEDRHLVLRILFLAAFAALTLASPARAGPFTAEQENRVRAIVREYLVQHPEVLDEALSALEARKAAQRRAQIERDPRRFSVGPANAKITIVEFFDYHCPYCKAALDWVSPKLRTRKDIRWVFVEFPILGPESLEASRAAVASIKQGKYLPFHLALMRSRGALQAREIDALARSVGLDLARLHRDMTDPAIMTLLQENHDIAAVEKIEGTPAFMINGEWFRGYDPEGMDKRLRQLTAGSAKRQASR